MDAEAGQEGNAAENEEDRREALGVESLPQECFQTWVGWLGVSRGLSELGAQGEEQKRDGKPNSIGQTGPRGSDAEQCQQEATPSGCSNAKGGYDQAGIETPNGNGQGYRKAAEESPWGLATPAYRTVSSS